MNIVIIGHVDHGKSTVIGRLLADTGSLPEGRLESVKESCRRNAKPFEYAFLLDALKDEQSQGITIDTARCFFRSDFRDYIIIDAPGHIEFLKNMITGASRAEAALLVIDAREGIQENSKRHGHMAAMLGIRQVTVLVNKMDLVDYREEVFSDLRDEYTAYLRHLDLTPLSFIPVSARDGDNIAEHSLRMPWYSGHTVLRQLDLFRSAEDASGAHFRFPVQDIYKFTGSNDDRRIVAGTVLAGSIEVGEKVVFQPSGKQSVIRSVESFNTPSKRSAGAGQAAGFTLETQLYIRPGEIMLKISEPSCEVGSRFRANVFWLGRAPLVKGREYKLKVGTARVAVKLAEINNTLDSSDLVFSRSKQQLDCRDVGECIFETVRPVAFDTVSTNEATGRFVVVDNYEIAGGGIILENLSSGQTPLQRHISERERHWEYGLVRLPEREHANGHRAKFILFTGSRGSGKRSLAKQLEQELFSRKLHVYYLGLAALEHGLDADLGYHEDHADERLRRIGELARILTDTGLIFIAVADDADDYAIEVLRQLNAPNEVLVVAVGDHLLSRFSPDLQIPAGTDDSAAVERLNGMLATREIIADYHI